MLLAASNMTDECAPPLLWGSVEGQAFWAQHRHWGTQEHKHVRDNTQTNSTPLRQYWFMPNIAMHLVSVTIARANQKPTIHVFSLQL